MSSAKSIRSKLLNISRNENLYFQQVLVRFFHERFLERLSKSKYKENLLLKGGSFIYAQQGNTARPTIDIDFLGQNISNDTAEIIHIAKEICKISSNDFVVFKSESIQAIPINEQKEYHGTRLKIEVNFDTIKQHIQIDVGFGDKITPNAVLLSYPVLLQEFIEPTIVAYTIETSIAEKLHAIEVLANLNSRIKDFYDVYTFIIQKELDNNLLLEALKNTFDARFTRFEIDKIIKTINDFKSVENNVKMWNTFLKKINAKEQVSFEEAMKIIISKLEQIDNG